ncbi:ABC transporter substrate-binding protein [bacterium]|nr:ABC transporter substrate-binding protein [bacterium]
MSRVPLFTLILFLPFTLSSAAVSTAEQKSPSAQKSLRYGNTPDRYVPFRRFAKPYKEFFLEPIEFTGPGREKPEPEGLEFVKIGFLGPIEKTVSVATGGMSHEEPLGIKMLQGVQLAIKQANARGGYRNRIPYKLIVRNDNGLWGASGNEIIDLAYKEKVWAIIGTIDGANSHIAIRAALKAELPIMNTGDTDPTFIETNIPWVFRCISDDRQMCYLLADYAYNKLGLKRIAGLRASNRYGRINMDEFRDGSRRRGHPLVAELQYRGGDTDFRPQLQRIKSLNVDGVVTYGDAQESGLILKQMREMGMTDQVFLASDRIVFDEFLKTVGEKPGQVIAGYPYDPTLDNPKLHAFRKAFRESFNEEPEAYAAHGYDGACIIIEGIEKAGLNRALIRDSMAEIERYHGVTGEIIFDATHNDVSPASLAILQNGTFNFYTREELFGPKEKQTEQTSTANSHAKL